jgi:hypothetical protein
MRVLDQSSVVSRSLITNDDPLAERVSEVVSVVSKEEISKLHKMGFRETAIFKNKFATNPMCCDQKSKISIDSIRLYPSVYLALQTVDSVHPFIQLNPTRWYVR